MKKLLCQRKTTGDIAPRHHYSGNKPKITAAHRQRLAELVREQPDITLEELRDAIGVNCTVSAIHYVLKAQDLSFKKRHSIPPNKTAPTSGSGAMDGEIFSVYTGAVLAPILEPNDIVVMDNLSSHKNNKARAS